MKPNNSNPLTFRLPAKTLVVLMKNGHRLMFILKLARLVPMSSTASIKIVNELEDLGLVKTIKENTKRYVQLTKKGKEITNTLMHIQSLVDNTPNPI